MNYIEITDILSDDTLGLSLAGAPILDDLDQKERDNVLNKAIEVKLYERLPYTVVTDTIIAREVEVTAILSDIKSIASQQVKWINSVNSLSSSGFSIKTCLSSEVIPTEDSLLIAEDKKSLKKFSRAGGKILPFSNATQYQFIIEQLTA